MNIKWKGQLPEKQSTLSPTSILIACMLYITTAVTDIQMAQQQGLWFRKVSYSAPQAKDHGMITMLTMFGGGIRLANLF